MQNHILCRSFRSRLLAGAAFAVAGISPGFAQDAAPAAEEPTVEKVTVTGSRLRKRDYTTTSPVTTLSSQTFELTQTNSVERLLNDLPQLVPGNTHTSNNAGGEAFATIDLRGLGPNRTLVLINGNRLPASSTTGTADINTIPAGLIDRVEVVTGGASAVYGSDAMSGVVNFVLKKNYEGMEFTASASQAEHGFGEERDVQALIGGNFAGGNGNITMFGEYFSREGVLQSEQEFSRVAGGYCYTAAGQWIVCDSAAEAASGNITYVGLGGSGTPPWGVVLDSAGNPFDPVVLNANPQFANGNFDCDTGTVGTPYAGGNLSFNDAGFLTPQFASGPCGVPDRAAGSSRYNYAPDNYIVIPAERYNVSVFGHYDLEKDLKLNFGAIYSDSRSTVQLAATPATNLTITYGPTMQAFIAGVAPDLSAALASRPDSLADFLMNWRSSQVGLRVSDDENSSLSLFTSLEGSLAANWNYEVSASFADVDFVSRAANSINKTALSQGLAGCTTRTPGPDTVLGTADDIDVPLGLSALPGCVTLDIFGPGNLTPEMANFLRVNTWSRTAVEETIASAFISGDLADVFGAGPIALVVGAEYRETEAAFEVDNEQRTGNIFGFNATQDQRGTIDVYEAYSEASIPLVKDQPYIYYLAAEAGYRISEYSTAGVVNTYKYGGEYSPFEWLKFRGIYNRATRVPSVFEAFQNGDQGFPSYDDVCKDVLPADGIPDEPGVSITECNTVGGGVGALNYPGFTQTNAQVEAFAFGNSSLSPETAETTTLGIVLQTGNDWFGYGNLRASVDRYEIEITDVIADFGAQFFINDCYVNDVATSCARIFRDSVGQIDFVNTSRGNQGSLATEGYDIQVDYRLDLDDIGLAGALTVNELYSIIDSYTINGGEFAGTTSAGIGTAIFDWKSVLSVQYLLDEWTLYTRWSYVPELIETGWDTASGHTYAPAASYVDVAARYAPVDWLAITLTVSNVADDDAPQTLNGLFSQGNTDPQVYDVLGRTWALSVKTKL